MGALQSIFEAIMLYINHKNLESDSVDEKNNNFDDIVLTKLMKFDND